MERLISMTKIYKYMFVCSEMLNNTPLNEERDVECMLKMNRSRYRTPFSFVSFS